MIKTIFQANVYKNDIPYTVTAQRETMPTLKRYDCRYRVYVGVEWSDGVTKCDRIGMDEFDTAADCANYAVTTTADWLRR